MKERIGQTMIDYLIEGVDYQSSVSTQQILLGTSFDLLCLVIIACSPKLFSVGLLFAFLETHYILFFWPESKPNSRETSLSARSCNYSRSSLPSELRLSSVAIRDFGPMYSI